MPKRLILFRHAKSSWADNVDDHERPLAERGRKAAPRMARWLAENGLKPTLVLVSTARRTQETWALMSAELGKVQKRDASEIYEASSGQLIDLISSVEPSVDSLMIIGHNPGLEDLTHMLMKGDGGEAGASLRAKFPTAAAAVLSLPADDWTEVAPRSATLEHFVTPKTLRPR